MAGANGYLIKYAQEVRMYGLLLLLTLTSLWLFARLLNREGQAGLLLLALFFVNLPLVYTHYYGVVLVCVGLTGIMQTTWWQLEQTLNNKKLAPDAHLTAIQDLEHRSFFVGDVFLFVVVIFFFTATLLSSSDNTGSMHNGAVISEFITLFLLWLQLVYLFWRCCALLAVEPITLTNDTHRLAITFVVLMIPYTVMQSIN
jgi:hypothetical protein